MTNLNLVLFNAIHQFAGPSRFLDGAGLFVADTLTYLLVLGGFIFLWRLPSLVSPREIKEGKSDWRRRIFAAAEICLAILISRGLIAEGIRFFYHHARPFVALNFTPLLAGETPYDSFPSGHMTALFAFAMVLYCLNRKWGIWYFALSLLVGIARIYVGVHWPLDILGGILIGLASGWAVHRLARPYWEKLRNS